MYLYYLVLNGLRLNCYTKFDYFMHVCSFICDVSLFLLLIFESNMPKYVHPD